MIDFYCVIRKNIFNATMASYIRIIALTKCMLVLFIK